MKQISAFVICALLVFLTVAESSAQPAPNADKQYGVIFTFRGLSDIQLNSFRGGIGGKYRLSENRFLRGTLGFNLTSESQDSELSGSEDTDRDYSLTLSPGIEMHFGERKRISPYWGPELVLDWSRSSEETQPSGMKRTASAFALSVGAFAGVEWFVRDEWSVAGEYNIRLTYQRSSTKRESGGQTTDKTTTTRWDFDTAALGRLIVTIYF